MNETQRQLVAWQTTTRALLHALIKTHHSPIMLREAFDGAMESMLASLISSDADDAMLTLTEQERALVHAMFERRIPRFERPG